VTTDGTYGFWIKKLISVFSKSIVCLTAFAISNWQKQFFFNNDYCIFSKTVSDNTALETDFRSVLPLLKRISFRLWW